MSKWKRLRIYIPLENPENFVLRQTFTFSPPPTTNSYESSNSLRYFTFSGYTPPPSESHTPSVSHAHLLSHTHPMRHTPPVVSYTPPVVSYKPPTSSGRPYRLPILPHPVRLQSPVMLNLPLDLEAGHTGPYVSISSTPPSCCCSVKTWLHLCMAIYVLALILVVTLI